MAELRADNNSLSPPSVRLAVGSVFAGRYRVESLLGEGATSAVYVARDFASEDENGASPCVALKVIHRHLLGDPQVFPRFRREALLLRRVTDAHVVRLRDFVERHRPRGLRRPVAGHPPRSPHRTGSTSPAILCHDV